MASFRRRSVNPHPINPFTLFGDDRHLLALVKTFNEPQFNHPDAQPFLRELIDLGYLKDTSRSESSRWWTRTKEGQEVFRAFVDWMGPEKKRFQDNTYGLWR
jgi:hypothetical protein